MGTYNTVRVDLECPRCRGRSCSRVDLYFGVTYEMRSLALGDEYPFYPNRQPQNGGPVPFGRGYTVCGRCQRDFWCTARIVEGRLISVEVDFTTPPCIPDADGVGPACSTCGGTTRERMFDGFGFVQVICERQCPHSLVAID